MKNRQIVLAIVLIFVLSILIAAPVQVTSSGQPAPAPHGLAIAVSPATPSVLGPAQGTVSHIAPAANLTFPRTVLVETFTAVWCIHCPAETEALHSIDLNSSENTLAIAELHVCAFAPGQGPCLEPYVPPDGTSTTRGTFYGVCGYPDVFFDGLNDSCGATNSASQMMNEYEDNIANASSVPAPLGIAQNSWVSGDDVVAHANITSGINGSFNAITYLLEDIDKQNINVGYGPHDVDHVVRETLYNHPVTLTAGQTTEITATGPLNSTWNTHNLSVITLVQQNSSKIVENANMTTVATVLTSFTSNTTSLLSGGSASLTVQVTNATTHLPVAGADVVLNTTAGVASPLNAATNASGEVTATFQAPSVTSTTFARIQAIVSGANGTTVPQLLTLQVNPIIRPDVPTGLQVSPANQQVDLNWTTPASGATGVTYHLYRASSATGTYSQVEVSSTTTFVDTGVLPGQVYWYKVCAQNTGGFSGNTTATAATSLVVTPQGLPPSVGWWFSVHSLNASLPTSSALSLFLAPGFTAYNAGPDSYAYVLSGTLAPVAVGDTALSLNVSFLPRYASLQGSVTPLDASVTVNGAAVSVSSGSFTELLAAGTYLINVTASGYTGNSTSVTLTPGNTTQVTVLLHALPSTGSSTTANGGLSTDDMIGIVAAAVVVVAVLIAVASVMGKNRRRRPPPRAPPAAPRSPGTGP